ncbi:hypothetical protein WR25_03420 [Diploscapter pachys]|uniref:dTCF n=1 Tax=Diploscapter pachys TaxID=2018661 RepID=A0A2A2J7H3_9BILA|nr:hypothetical protein WR25_03420 [Diploscapter pachys]
MASPSYFHQLLPPAIGAPISPAYVNMMFPWMFPATAAAYGMQQTLSPSYCLLPHVATAAAAMSPSFTQAYNAAAMMMAGGPQSPIYRAAAMAVHQKAQENLRTLSSLNPVQPNLPTASQGVPLSQLQQNLRMPYANLNGAMPDQVNGGGPIRRSREHKPKKDDHIKKPLNAFMWFMKENRPKLMEEQGYKEKQSAELNKELGKRWHALDKEEQQRYYDMAKKESEEHRMKHPTWTAKDNYAVHKKKKKRRDKSIESTEQKKCRARFGLAQQDRWCKYCKRKKKCEFSYDRTNEPLSIVGEMNERVNSTSSGPSPMTSSIGGPSPSGPSPMEHTPTSMESGESDDDDDDDIDGPDATITMELDSYVKQMV